MALSSRCGGATAADAGRRARVLGPLPFTHHHASGLSTSSNQGCRSVQCSASTLLNQSIGRKPKTPEQLQDPARIGATGRSSKTFQIQPHQESLTSYMLLPVEQYFVLDPKQISFLGGNRFMLTVPRINILNVWLEAMVEVSVVTERTPQQRVLLRAENCRIKGSDLIENLKLDQRFCMAFDTEITWKESSVAAAGSAPPPVPTAVTAGIPGPVGVPLLGELSATLKLDVWSEVIPPFNLLPRDVLISTCNGVMRGLVNSLLPLFVRQLSSDYEKWSNDPQYRTIRAARSIPLSSAEY